MKNYAFAVILIMSILFPNEISYIGDWPINENKNDIINPISECPLGIGCECENNSDCYNNNCEQQLRGSYCTLQEGNVFPEFIGYDQFGEKVNIYDFANQGKYILLEMGSSWCSPCQKLAAYLAYNDLEITTSRIWKAGYEKIYDMVRNDEVYFITVLYEDMYNDNASKYTVEEWYSMYDDQRIPILADENKFLHRIIKPTGIPAVLLIDDKMNIAAFASRGFNVAFDKLLLIKKDQ